MTGHLLKHCFLIYNKENELLGDCRKMELSEKVKSLTPSQTIEITNTARKLKADGYDIISLSAGEPDFNTPEEVIEAAHQAALDGHTKYTASVGIKAVRQAIAEKMLRDNNLSYTPDEVYVGNGAKQVLFNIFLATLNPTDEVLLPAPYWVSYSEQIKMVGGEPVTIETTEDTNFKLTPELLKAHITEKTKMIVLNSPNNPTGGIYSKEELQALVDVLEHTDIIVVVDEIYEVLAYEREHISIASLSEKIKGQSIIVNGFSKSHAMTGWRIGYACGPLNVIKALGDLSSQSTTSVASPSQYAAIKAYNMSDDFKNDYVSTFKARRDNAYEKLMTVPHVRCIKPEGAFYLFPYLKDIASQCGYDSVDDFVKGLLTDQHVAIVPGAAFGAKDYARISYSVSEEKFNEGIERIKTFINKKTTV